jgi:putative membrane protein insertion efficiency factor
MLTKILVALVRCYQLTLSGWVGWQCRFVPSCSNYAIEALQRHGALKGTWMTVARLLRCHPVGGSGYDPVPEKFRWRCWRKESDQHTGKMSSSND